MPASHLDEQKLRRPEFRGDVQVILADRQTWFLPRPRVKFSRKSHPDGSRSLVTRVQLGPDYAAALDAYELAIEKGDGAALATFDLAVALLRENYSLSDEEADGLLEILTDDPENQATWSVIMATAMGQGPKSSEPGEEEP